VGPKIQITDTSMQLQIGENTTKMKINTDELTVFREMID
jgi:hypothetical protein